MTEPRYGADGLRIAEDAIPWRVCAHREALYFRVAFGDVLLCVDCRHPVVLQDDRFVIVTTALDEVLP